MNPIYFISDLHLSSVESPTTRSFFDFLDNKISTPTSLYILGDLFEVWIGDDDDSELAEVIQSKLCLLYTSPSPRDLSTSRMPSSA